MEKDKLLKKTKKLSNKIKWNGRTLPVILEARFAENVDEGTLNNIQKYWPKRSHLLSCSGNIIAFAANNKKELRKIVNLMLRSYEEEKAPELTAITKHRIKAESRGYKCNYKAEIFIFPGEDLNKQIKNEITAALDSIGISYTNTNKKGEYKLLEMSSEDTEELAAEEMFSFFKKIYPIDICDIAPQGKTRKKDK